MPALIAARYVPPWATPQANCGLSRPRARSRRRDWSVRSTRYAWSTDGGESYYGDEATREDAVKEALKNEPLVDGSVIFTGEILRYPASHFAYDADQMIERMTEESAEEMGECSEGWLDDVTQADKESLQSALDQAINDWCKAHGQEPWFFTVDHAEAQLLSLRCLEGCILKVPVRVHPAAAPSSRVPLLPSGHYPRGAIFPPC